ncbi:MAG: hypothetical protein P8X74_09565 [Reinekea sp.]
MAIKKYGRSQRDQSQDAQRIALQEQQRLMINGVQSVNIGTPQTLEDPVFVAQALKIGKIARIDNIYSATATIKSDVVGFEGTSFGALQHIQSTDAFFTNAWEGIRTLRESFLNDDDNEEDISDDEEDALIKRIFSYFNEVENKAVYPTGKARSFLTQRQLLFSHFKRGTALDESALKAKFKINEDTLPGSAKYYQGLFGSSDVLTKDMHRIGRLKRALSDLHNYQVRELAKARTELAELENELPEAHRQLSSLNRQRQQSLADYQVARMLIAENWADVEKEYANRAEILNSHKGIYYARVRETPLNNRPVTDLPLRPGRLEDLVPGYPLTDAELPGELEPFIEAVLDIPMADWSALSRYSQLLPSRALLKRMVGLRAVRLAYLAEQPAPQFYTPLGYKLFGMRGFNRSIQRSQSRAIGLQATSLIAYQRQSAKLLSLEDLLNGPPHRLRGLVQRQRNRIDQATHSLLQTLRHVSPAIRLDWSGEAEADTLDMSKPERWPGLGKAEARDLNSVRTLVELVQWWWRQLTDDASSDAVSAVRNLLRAILMFSAADDPEQILHGQLQTIPGRFKLGDALRVTLNREALPGTLLQLVGSQNELVATLRVDDFDDNGAVTTLTQMHNSSVMPNTNFTVTGYALPGTVR